MSRAGSTLLFGLAPRGVFRALAIASEAVGSYPTFSPLPTCEHCETSRRFCLRDATVLRSAGGFIFCGTIRGFALLRSPLALPGALPCQEFWPRKSLAMPQDGVRTFLPLLRLAAQQPAITRPARYFNYTL